MGQYLLRRLIQAVITAFCVIVLVFLMLRLTGDPSTAILSKEAPADVRAQFRHQMGWDRPVALQLVDYLSGITRGDFGLSYKYSLPVTMLLLERLPATVELALAGMLLAVLVGVPIAVLSATRPHSFWSTLADFMGTVGLSTPSFWAGIIFIIVFGVYLRLLPVAGAYGYTSLILPAVTMSLTFVGQLIRITRATMFEVLRQDYIRTARAKGLPQTPINYRHALRNAAIPIVSVLGINLGYMMGGSVVIETVFAWPGVGFLTYQAVTQRDFVLVQAVTLFTSWVVLMLNLATDLLYGFLDPRVSYHKGVA